MRESTGARQAMREFGECPLSSCPACRRSREPAFGLGTNSVFGEATGLESCAGSIFGFEEREFIAALPLAGGNHAEPASDKRIDTLRHWHAVTVMRDVVEPGPPAIEELPRD